MLSVSLSRARVQVGMTCVCTQDHTRSGCDPLYFCSKQKSHSNNFHFLTFFLTLDRPIIFCFHLLSVCKVTDVCIIFHAISVSHICGIPPLFLLTLSFLSSTYTFVVMSICGKVAKSTGFEDRVAAKLYI